MIANLSYCIKYYVTPKSKLMQVVFLLKNALYWISLRLALSTKKLRKKKQLNAYISLKDRYIISHTIHDTKRNTNSD